MTPPEQLQAAGEDGVILQKLTDLMVADIMKGGKRFKVTELLKTIELKRKLAPADDNEQKFWKMIGDVREKAIPPGKANPTFELNGNELNGNSRGRPNLDDARNSIGENPESSDGSGQNNEN